MDTEDQSTQRNLSQCQFIHHKYHTDQNQIKAWTKLLLCLQFDKSIYWITGVKTSEIFHDDKSESYPYIPYEKLLAQQQLQTWWDVKFWNI